MNQTRCKTRRSRGSKRNKEAKALDTDRPATLRIHELIPYSRANGPGLRCVIWVQGCSLGCPGCFNPQTHALQGGRWVEVDGLFGQIKQLENTIQGLTISGGEPLQQPQALLKLLKGVRQETGLSTLVFSGFTWEEILRFPRAADLLAQIDVLIAGRYDQGRRLAHGLIGSENKTLHFLTDRYTIADLQAVPEAEALITTSGEILLSGINPVTL